MALREVLRGGRYHVEALLTTLSDTYRRIGHHGVREELLDEQSRSLGVPLEKMFLPDSPSNTVYEAQMREVLTRYKARGVEAVVFGDIFLEDLRRWREEKLALLDMKGIFPLWGERTPELARRFISLGFKAKLVCIDPNKLGAEFAGRQIDEEMLADLPPDVDPCGENGEYHSFVYDGPIYSFPIEHELGQVEQHGNNLFCEVLPLRAEGNRDGEVLPLRAEGNRDGEVLPLRAEGNRDGEVLRSRTESGRDGEALPTAHGSEAKTP